MKGIVVSYCWKNCRMEPMRSALIYVKLSLFLLKKWFYSRFFNWKYFAKVFGRILLICWNTKKMFITFIMYIIFNYFFVFIKWGTVFSVGTLKVNIQSSLFCKIIMVMISCGSFCPQIWLQYQRCELKIAKYIVRKWFLLIKCLIFASRPFGIFNLVLSHFNQLPLHVRFLWSIIPSYLVWVNRWIF